MSEEASREINIHGVRLTWLTRELIQSSKSMARRKRNISNVNEWFGLVWFYGISIFGGYLMPNTFNAKCI